MKNANFRDKHHWGTIWYDSSREQLADTLHDTGKVYVTLFDRDEVYAGAATTVRDAYREAYRRLRLGRHDTVDLLRERAALRAIIAKRQHDCEEAQKSTKVATRGELDARFDHDAITLAGRTDNGAWHRAIEVARSLVAAGVWNGTDRIEFDAYALHDRLFGVAAEDPGNLVAGVDYVVSEDAAPEGAAHPSDADTRSHRRARMALAIRAHHAALDEQAARYEESLRTTRRTLIERTKERGELVSALGIVLREIAAARENNPYVRFHIPDVTSGKTEDLIAAVRALCDLAAEYDALHRRATSAEQRIDGWRRTVERLEAEIARS